MGRTEHREVTDDNLNNQGAGPDLRRRKFPQGNLGHGSKNKDQGVHTKKDEGNQSSGPHGVMGGDPANVMVANLDKSTRLLLSALHPPALAKGQGAIQHKRLVIFKPVSEPASLIHKFIAIDFLDGLPEFIGRIGGTRGEGIPLPRQGGEGALDAQRQLKSRSLAQTHDCHHNNSQRQQEKAGPADGEKKRHKTDQTVIEEKRPEPGKNNRHETNHGKKGNEPVAGPHPKPGRIIGDQGYLDAKSDESKRAVTGNGDFRNSGRFRIGIQIHRGIKPINHGSDGGREGGGHPRKKLHQITQHIHHRDHPQGLFLRGRKPQKDRENQNTRKDGEKTPSPAGIPAKHG